MSKITISGDLLQGRSIHISLVEREPGSAPVRRISLHAGVEARVLDDLPPLDPDAPAVFRYRIKTIRLNIREGPGLNHLDVGNLYQGQIVQAGPIEAHGQYWWAELTDKRGWFATGTLAGMWSLAERVN